MAKSYFELSDEDIKRLQDGIKAFGDGAERILNDYLEHEANEIFREEITKLIPVSNRDKKHAKDSNPLKGELTDNLELYIHTKTKYNYLFFPQEAYGVHFEGKEPNDFMSDGVEAKIDNVINGMLDALQNGLKL